MKVADDVGNTKEIPKVERSPDCNIELHVHRYYKF